MEAEISFIKRQPMVIGVGVVGRNGERRGEQDNWGKGEVEMDYSLVGEKRKPTTLKLSQEADKWFKHFCRIYGKSKQGVLQDVVTELKFQTVGNELMNSVPVRIKIKLAVRAILQRRSFREIRADYVKPPYFHASDKLPKWMGN